MAFPSDVLLPSNPKYYGFVDKKAGYNPNWDIVWSFSFALTGTQHAFCTYLTTNPSISAGIPGQYLGYLGSSEFILAENLQVILTENNEELSYDDITSTSSNEGTNGVFSIAFDSTGYFALSSENNSGVGLGQVNKNSLIIRDSTANVIYNKPLSSLDTSFFLSSSAKSYQTLRFRFSNAGKIIYIDYKSDLTAYKNLLTLPISFNINNTPILYPAFTFCSPISSSFITPSTLFLKNFHTRGSASEPTYEIVPCVELSRPSTKYTTISGILHKS